MLFEIIEESASNLFLIEFMLKWPIKRKSVWIFNLLILQNCSNVTFVALNRVIISPLSANPTKWSNTLKEFVGKLPTNCLSVFDHFVGLAFKGLV